MDGHSHGLLGALGMPDWMRGILRVDAGDDAPSDRFASWLPYRTYLPDSNIFVNRGSLGVTLEVMPQSGADDRMVEVLVSLYAGCPAETGVQIQLFSSPHLSLMLKRYASLRWEDENQTERSLEYGRPVRNQNLFRLLARRRVEFLLRAAQKSITPGFHYTVRDFRLMISISVPGDADDHAARARLSSLRDTFETTLKAALFPTHVCNASDLINWCALFTNPDRLLRSDCDDVEYDDGREVRDQIVDYDTVQDASARGLLLWKPDTPYEIEARFMSVKSYPKSFKLWQMGSLIGDPLQAALQYNGPFLLTMGVHMLDPITSKSVITANHLRATQNAESKMAKIMPDVARKLEDWTAVAAAADAGGTLVSMYHQLAVFAPPGQVHQCCESAKAIWRSRGFTLNADICMQRQALLASLPMTLSPEFHKDLKKMRRVTRKNSFNALHLAPLIGEWRGTTTPTLQFAGRRGQLMQLDLFDNNLGNPNFAAIGAPGSGKSVLLNEIAWSYRAVGAKVIMMEIGRSFEKLCRKAKGTYVEFEPTSRININPFTKVIDINEDIEMLVPAIAKMCSAHKPLEELQYKSISVMVLKLWKQYGQDMTVTALRDAMLKGTIEDLNLVNDPRIRDLGVMLSPYSKGGQYEKFFEGKNNIDMTNDFIVIENEHLKRKPDLHSVVNILLLYQITGEMYLDRSRKKLLMIDELKQLIGETGPDDMIMAAAVEEAARRARKYGGALGTATQGADDYYCSVQMEAAFNCSDWVFLMRQKPESIELLDRKGRLSMDAAKKRMLGSLRTEPGVFSECYISSPIGEGVGRLILDPATLLLFSNKLEDNLPLDQLQAQGLSIDDAIQALLRQRGQA